MSNCIITCLYLIRKHKLTEHLLYPPCLLLNQQRVVMCPQELFWTQSLLGGIAPQSTPCRARVNTCCYYSFSNRKTHHGAKCIWLQCPQRPVCTWELITCENSNLKTNSSLNHMRAEKQGHTLAFSLLNNLFPFSLCLFCLLILSLNQSASWTANSLCCFFSLDWIFTASHKPLEIGFIMEPLMQA